MPDRALVSPLFDAAWYAATYPDVAGTDPWTHFQRIGTAAGRDPNPLFNTAWYLRRYPEVARSGAKALEDYVSRGVELGRDPGPLFSTRWYLTRNPDVAAARVNPLQHYLSSGLHEQRDPSPIFDTAWYFSTYPDAAAPRVDARVHYMELGALLGYDPCPLFSTRWYLETYPEVAASGENPLLHYILSGAARAFDPSPHFSTSSYLAGHKEVAASGENPLVHHLAHERGRHRPTMNAVAELSGQLSQSAIAEAQAVIQALSPIEPDIAALPAALEGISVVSFTLDRAAPAWRGLYLSIYELPQRLVLVGSIDDTLELARLSEDTAGLLIVETDARAVSTAELLPRCAQWRSLGEFGVDLDLEDRIRVVSALVNGLQPAALLVWGSQAGWEMLARHGAALRRNTALFATAAASPELSAAQLLRSYFRSCIPVLSALYGPDGQELHRIADLFGLPSGEHGKLRELGDWRGADGFLSPAVAGS